MNRSRVVHPLLLAAFPALAIYSQNVNYTSPASLLHALVAVELALLLVWLPLRVIARDRHKAGLCLSLLVVVCFSFGILAALVETLGGGGVLTRFRRVTLVVDAAVLVTVGTLVLRSRRDLSAGTAALNRIGVALVAVAIASAIWGIVRTGGRARVKPAEFRAEIAFDDRVSHPRRPDIYFIVLDAYGRHDVLRDVYGFDNRDFLAHLRSMGFTIADESLAHYPRTMLSLASTLNMEYAHTILGRRLPHAADSEQLLKASRNSRVVQVLRQRFGYRFVAFATGFEWTECKNADLYLGPRANVSFGELGNAIFNLTPLPILMAKLMKMSPLRWHRDRVLFTLDHLANVSDIDGPTFTFAHILSPHAPYIFDANGNDVSESDETLLFQAFDPDLGSGTPEENRIMSDRYRSRYREQAIYITNRIEPVIREILRRSPEPPIIVLQSDHGPSSPEMDEGRRLWENLANLSAIYVPAGAPAPCAADCASPINLFRFVLREHFGARLGALEPEHYWYDDRRVDPVELVPFARVQRGPS